MFMSLLMSDSLRCMLKRVRYLVPLGMLVVILAGCGYTLVGTSSDTPGKRLPLAIVPFTNRTREPDLERLTTAALRHAMLHSQVFVSRPEDGAAQHLQGVIQRFRSFPLSLDANDSVLQYRIEADISLRLLEASTRRPILEQDMLVWAEYLVSRTPTDRVREDVVAREAALFRLAQQFADKCLALLAIALL
jgi:hypothetical protein